MKDQKEPSYPSLRSPAPEILGHLARHPDAQDTIDGILHWWVLDACIRKWAPKIAETVAQLAEQGFLEQNHPPMARCFTACPRVISPHFSNGHQISPERKLARLCA